MKEIWKQIDGFDGYFVSNLGRVASKNCVLKQMENKDGYLKVNIRKNNRQFTKTVHRLVASAFIPNDNSFPQVNHKDENKKNNCTTNLEWCDEKYNANYGTLISRLQEIRGKRVLQIKCKIGIKEFISVSDASRETGISRSSISACCRGKRKSAGGFQWTYIPANK